MFQSEYSKRHAGVSQHNMRCQRLCHWGRQQVRWDMRKHVGLAAFPTPCVSNGVKLYVIACVCVVIHAKVLFCSPIISAN